LESGFALRFIILRVHKLLEDYHSKVGSLKQLLNSRARRIAKSISFKRFIPEEIKLTGKLYKEAGNVITQWHQFKLLVSKGEKLLQVSCVRERQMNK